MGATTRYRYIVTLYRYDSNQLAIPVAICYNKNDAYWLVIDMKYKDNFHVSPIWELVVHGIIIDLQYLNMIHN